jgi:hypothetical protein
MTGDWKIESQKIESRDQNYFYKKVQVIKIIYSVYVAICKIVQEIEKVLGTLGG